MFGIRCHYQIPQQAAALIFAWPRSGLISALCYASVLLGLAGCAAEPVVVAVDLPLAQPPKGTLVAPSAAPKLPSGDMSVAELATAYGSLQGRYVKETRRFAVLQKYVKALHKRKRSKKVATNF